MCVCVSVCLYVFVCVCVCVYIGVKVYPYGTLPAEKLVSKDSRGDPCWLEDTGKGKRWRYAWMVEEDSLEFQKVYLSIYLSIYLYI